MKPTISIAIAIYVATALFASADAYGQGADQPEKARLIQLDQIVTRQVDPSPAELRAMIVDALASDTPRVRAQAFWTVSARVAEARFDSSPEAAQRASDARAALLPLRDRIIAGLADADPKVRIAAMGALGNLDFIPGSAPGAVTISPDTASVLANHLGVEQAVGVRGEIVKAFALLSSEQAANIRDQRDKVIRTGLADQDEDVVALAITGIGRQQITELLPAAVSALKSESVHVRMASAQTIAMFGPSALKHIGDLQTAADTETDPKVKQTLEGAILRIRGISR